MWTCSRVWRPPPSAEVPPEDAKENERSVRDGYRLLSSYQVGEEGEERIWIITEADRSSTCLLLPSEY